MCPSQITETHKSVYLLLAISKNRPVINVTDDYPSYDHKHDKAEERGICYKILTVDLDIISHVCSAGRHNNHVIFELLHVISK